MRTSTILLVLLPASTAFVLSCVLTPLMARLARATGMVAITKDDRWHQGRVPLLGGAAVCLATLAGAIFWAQPGAGLALRAMGAGGVMFAVGLLDDVIGLKPNTKLTAQIAVACVVVFLGPASWVSIPVVDTLLTIMWIVGITNALNLLDNMDGLCAGIAAIAAAAFCASVGNSDPALLTYGAALAGAAAGFLVYNFQPASIFMGDCGSLFLGVSLAVLSLGAGTSGGKSGLLSTMAVPVLLLAIPIFDTTFVTLTRKLSLRSASVGGRDHTSHRLVALGFSERSAVLMCYALAAGGGFTAVALGRTSLPEVNVLMGLLVITFLLLAVHLGRVKVYDGADYAALTRTRYTPLAFTLMHKRRIFEVFLDLCLVTVAYYGAYVLRFDADFPRYYGQFEQSLPVIIACELVVFFGVGLYRGLWRYMGVSDLTTYVKAVLGGSLASVMAIVYLFRFEGYSRGVFIINAMALLLLIIGSRGSFRLIGELTARYGTTGRRVLVYGAGDGGVLLLRELRHNRKYDCRVIGLIDDNPAKQHKRIMGVPVLGGCEALRTVIAERRPEAVILSTSRLPPERLALLQKTCFESGTRLQQLEFDLKALLADHRATS